MLFNLGVDSYRGISVGAAATDGHIDNDAAALAEFLCKLNGVRAKRSIALRMCQIQAHFTS